MYPSVLPDDPVSCFGICIQAQTIKRLFNCCKYSIIAAKQKVNVWRVVPPERGKKVSERTKSEEIMKKERLPHHHGDEKELLRLREELQEVEMFRATSEIFKQLGDVTRLRLFWILCHCEECVINLSAMLEMSSPAVSHHLRALKQRDLIISNRRGKEVYYRISDTDRSRLLHETLDRLMSIGCWK